jgi:hypothetical protein
MKSLSHQKHHCCIKSLASLCPGSYIRLYRPLDGLQNSKGHSHDVAMLPGQGQKLTTTCLSRHWKL